MESQYRRRNIIMLRAFNFIITSLIAASVAGCGGNASWIGVFSSTSVTNNNTSGRTESQLVDTPTNVPHPPVLYDLPNSEPAAQNIATSLSATPIWMRPFLDALSQTKNIERGRALFTGACRNCHRLGTDGHHVGPHLAKAYLKSDRELLYDILDPGRKIAPEYQTSVVVTLDGFTTSGIREPDSHMNIVLRRENGLKQIILHTDIDVVRQSDVSLMPSNLRDQLTPDDVADLIAYVRHCGAAHTNQTANQ